MARERTRASTPLPATAQPQAAHQWVRRLVRSFGFAFAGVWSMLRHQRNAQIHAALTILVLIVGIVLRVSLSEWIALILCITLVLSLEALNTALEAVVDLASPEFHPLAKQAKDIAAGAVLIGAIGAALVGCIIFLPKLWALL
jgi:diacylglycerol kinase (ATP)